MDTNNDFYVGWMPKAPSYYNRFIKKYLLVLFMIIAVTGIMLAVKQKKFSTANFEFGKQTEVKGIYISLPVPHLLIADQNDFIMLPLVGYGKHGAEGVMDDLQKERNSSFENKELSIKGTLLYGDGKVLMQIDKNENPLVSISKPHGAALIKNEDMGQVTLKGEIIDPKCYFGVMKPGEGKPHKDCAIRCILGGIPPVLAITNEKGEKNYILLTSVKGSINEQVKNFVAVPTEVSGHLKKYNNWLVLEVGKVGEASCSRPTDLKSAKIEGASGCCKKM